MGGLSGTTALHHPSGGGPSAGRRAGARPLFGDPELERFYRCATSLIIERKIFRMCRVAEIEGGHQLTVCNLWRIERLETGALATWEYALAEGRWKEVVDLSHWPEIPLFPFREATALKWCKLLLRQAVLRVFIAASDGKLALKDFERAAAGDLDRRGRSASVPWVAWQMLAHYFGGRERVVVRADGNPRLERKAGWLNLTLVRRGAAAIQSALWRLIIERPVLSALLVIGHHMDVRRYLNGARHREGLLKVAREHRNLLPLLAGLQPQHWGRNDLFSQKVWVKRGRTPTLLDRPGFAVMIRGPLHDPAQRRRFVSFGQPAAWRWLSGASPRVTRAWVASGNNPTLVANLALANLAGLGERPPVIAYVRLFRSAVYRLERYGVSPAIQRLLRLFLGHCARRWRERGFKAVKRWLEEEATNAFCSLLDYLDAEGFDRGQPDRQATWPSLMRRSERWRARVAIERWHAETATSEPAVWQSAVPETAIDSITFRPLDSAVAGALEGFERHHCLGACAGRCRVGQFRAYAVIDASGNRSTLGLYLEGGRLAAIQHVAPGNGPVPPAVKAAGRALAARYRRALREGAPRSSLSPIPRLRGESS